MVSRMPAHAELPGFGLGQHHCRSVGRHDIANAPQTMLEGANEFDLTKDFVAALPLFGAGLAFAARKPARRLRPVRDLNGRPI